MRRIAQLPVFAVALAALLMPALPSVGNAAQVCGQNAQIARGNVKFHSRDFTATCQPGGACAVITHHLDHVAPLGFSHLFGFRRETPDGRWQAVLVDELSAADISAGFSFVVDQNKPAPVSSNLVAGAGEKPYGYYLDAGLTELVLAETKPANRIEWRYNSASGEARTASFSLIGLTDALAWANCAQAELASGKTDAAAPEEEEPEYSGAEEGVPVSPDGSEPGENDQ